jgi:hypothetical protein
MVPAEWTIIHDIDGAVHTTFESTSYLFRLPIFRLLCLEWFFILEPMDWTTEGKTRIQDIRQRREWGICHHPFGIVHVTTDELNTIAGHSEARPGLGELYLSTRPRISDLHGLVLLSAISVTDEIVRWFQFPTEKRTRGATDAVKVFSQEGNSG